MNPIIEKIKKLLALAGNNSNESEAARAMEMASTLMMKHGIEEDQVKGEVKQEIRPGTRYDDQAPFHRIVAQAVAELMGCSTYWYPRVKGVQFVGRPLNVTAAEELYVYVILQVEHLYRIELPKGLTQRERSQYRKTYKLACANRIHTRVRDIIRHQGLSTSEASTSRALVVQHREVLRGEIDEYNQARNIPSSRPMRVSYNHQEAAAKGWNAGSRVELNKGVDQ